jgi:hypothetical protein
LRLKAHVGEWGSADDVWRAVEELDLDEVQHGIAAAGSSAVGVSEEFLSLYQAKVFNADELDEVRRAGLSE